MSIGLEGVVREGVYTMVGGPNYETIAELKLLRALGVDSVGKNVYIFKLIYKRRKNYTIYIFY